MIWSKIVLIRYKWIYKNIDSVYRHFVPEFHIVVDQSMAHFIDDADPNGPADPLSPCYVFG